MKKKKRLTVYLDELPAGKGEGFAVFSEPKRTLICPFCMSYLLDHLVLNTTWKKCPACAYTVKV